MVFVTGREGQGALSEAGSAGIAAGQFGFCPMTSECSTAHNVRESDGHAARGYVGAASTEQDSYNPRPAGWEDAKHPYLPGEKAFFLLTAPPPFSFCRRKKKMGVESPQGMPCTPGWSTGPRRAAEVVGPYGGSAGSAQERAENDCFFR